MLVGRLCQCEEDRCVQETELPLQSTQERGRELPAAYACSRAE